MMIVYIPVSPFTLDERSNPEADVETLCLDFLYEPHQVISPTEIILRLTQNDFYIKFNLKQQIIITILLYEFNYRPLQVLAHADSRTHMSGSRRLLLL